MVTPTLRQITTERASDVHSAHEEQLITAATIFDHAASSRGLAGLLRLLSYTGGSLDVCAGVASRARLLFFQMVTHLAGCRCTLRINTQLTEAAGGCTAVGIFVLSW
jgi:hypothetical protein